MPVSFQARVGEGKVAYVAPGTRAIEGVSVVNADSIPNNTFVARKTEAGWEYPNDLQMFNYLEASSPNNMDPATLAFASNVINYNFATYRKVKTASPSAVSTISAATLSAVGVRWPSALIKIPMGATPYAITPVAPVGGYVEHGRPSEWVANALYLALIMKLDVPHLFWLAPGVVRTP